MNILTGEHLLKFYGGTQERQQIINNISLQVASGEFFGIMGPSGAGKTTLLKILSTMERPSAGYVYFKGQEITNLKEPQLNYLRNQSFGFIFQDFNLISSLNVQDNIALPLVIAKKSSSEISRRVEEVARLLGIQQLLTFLPEQISIGQRQRVAAARAMINRPEIIFADEPTGSLDSRNATELLQYLTKINQEEGTTIILVTHDPFTASYCQRIMFIKDHGIFAELIRAGTRQEFFKKVIQMQAAIGGG